MPAHTLGIIDVKKTDKKTLALWRRLVAEESPYA